MTGEPQQQIGCEGITLTFEAPGPEQKATETPLPNPQDELQYDEFGLPMKQPRRIYYDDDQDFSGEEEKVDALPPEKPTENQNTLQFAQPQLKTSPSAAQISDIALASKPLQPAPIPNDKLIEKKNIVEIENNRVVGVDQKHQRPLSLSEGELSHNAVKFFESPLDPTMKKGKEQISEWSHQQIVPREDNSTEVDDKTKDSEDEWQPMPAYASYDMYDDNGRLIARAHQESDDENAKGEAAKGYSRVYDDEDVESVTSMDENTKYLFRENENDDASRNPLSQMKATKDLLTEGQRIAYVGVCRLALIEMLRNLEKLKVKGKSAERTLFVALEGMQMWSQKMMVRLYTHMEISPPEQIMIEQLAEHGVLPLDLTPTLLQTSRVDNPMSSSASSPISRKSSWSSKATSPMHTSYRSSQSPLPVYEEKNFMDGAETLSEMPASKTIDIDLRWTVLCDLFLVLIADSAYDARSRVLLERVGEMLGVSWLDICKFEKRVSDALEMQESAEQSWNELEHMDTRRKQARTKRFMMLGLATVGGGLVIGLSGGLLAPVIGAGLATGLATVGIAGTSTFLAGAGGSALIASGAAISGSYIGGKAGFNRIKSVTTFEFKPLHNAKRVNLIITVSGWMNGKIDDVRLPFSTVDPIMGDLFSVFWEPEMLQSMGQTISILATEALSSTLQQVLGATVLMALMSALQLPIVLTKLSYLLDNPWSVSLDRAAAAGLILADTLVHRNLGVRPVTLVGYSLGARVIYFCLRELARVGAAGLVQNAYMFGSPVVVKKDEYTQAVAMVSGRFVNAYATNDWILGYLFRATSGGIGRVAGLAEVTEIPGVENVDVTDLVNGHMAYRTAIPKLLERVGWEITSDEFSEIEDPDPENHQVRQRELINELDEARKELDQGSKKRKWNFFGRNKDVTKKKDWETYMPTTETPTLNKPTEAKDNVLFDIEAIRAEIENEAKRSKANKANKEVEIMVSNLAISNSNDDKKKISPSSAGFTETKSAAMSDREGPRSHSSIGIINGGGRDYEGYSNFGTQNDHGGHEDFKMEFEPEGDVSVDTSRPGLTSSYSIPEYGNGFGYGGNVWDEYDDEFSPREDGELKLTFA